MLMQILLGRHFLRHTWQSQQRYLRQSTLFSSNLACVISQCWAATASQRTGFVSKQKMFSCPSILVNNNWLGWESLLIYLPTFQMKKEIFMCYHKWIKTSRKKQKPLVPVFLSLNKQSKFQNFLPTIGLCAAENPLVKLSPEVCFQLLNSLGII